jgi:hypothetical protein
LIFQVREGGFCPGQDWKLGLRRGEEKERTPSLAATLGWRHREAGNRDTEKRGKRRIQGREGGRSSILVSRWKSKVGFLGVAYL